MRDNTNFLSSSTSPYQVFRPNERLHSKRRRWSFKNEDNQNKRGWWVPFFPFLSRRLMKGTRSRMTVFLWVCLLSFIFPLDELIGVGFSGYFSVHCFPLSWRTSVTTAVWGYLNFWIYIESFPWRWFPGWRERTRVRDSFLDWNWQGGWNEGKRKNWALDWVSFSPSLRLLGWSTRSIHYLFNILPFFFLTYLYPAIPLFPSSR